MADVQKEHGYTSIANEILDNINKIPLNGSQLRILLTIWRYTYGFQRKEHPLSVRFLSNETLVDHKSTRIYLDFLEEKGYIYRIKKQGSTSILGFQKDYEKWDSVGELPHTTKKKAVGSLPHTTVGNFPHGTVGSLPHKLNKKENIKESTLVNFPSDLLPSFTKLKEAITQAFGTLTLPAEKTVKKLLQDGMEVAVFEEALVRTQEKANKPTFSYMKSILLSWKQDGLCSLSEVLAKDPKREEKETSTYNSISPSRSEEEVEADIQMLIQREREEKSL